MEARPLDTQAEHGTTPLSIIRASVPSRRPRPLDAARLCWASYSVCLDMAHVKPAPAVQIPCVTYLESSSAFLGLLGPFWHWAFFDAARLCWAILGPFWRGALTNHMMVSIGELHSLMPLPLNTDFCRFCTRRESSGPTAAPGSLSSLTLDA